MSYFHTDWSAMTGNDWFYTIFTSIIFIFMVILYVVVLNPKNKEKFEQQRYLPFEEDKTPQDFGENNVR